MGKNLAGWVEGRKEGRVDGWMDGWMEAKAGLRIAYSNKIFFYVYSNLKKQKTLDLTCLVIYTK